MSAKYLDHNTAVERLLKEFRTHGKIILGYDFDNTVCTYDESNPEPTLLRQANEEVCQLIRDLRPYSHLVLWTCRTNENGDEDFAALELAEQWLQEHDVPYDAVNEDGPVSYGGRKPYFNMLLDDRAGLAAAYEILKSFLEIVTDLFDADLARKNCVCQIQQYFHFNGGKEPKAVLGMSGGADSTIVGAMCCEAIGKENVYGYILPNGDQADLDEAIDICKILGINYKVVNIYSQVATLASDLGLSWTTYQQNEYLKNNLPALVRRNYLTNAAMMIGGRVMNTTNATEDFLGYITKGDNIAGDFAPILNYVKTEVQAIGTTYEEIPLKYIVKDPADGMCGETDEDRFGFSYQEADAVIRQACRPVMISKIEKIWTMNKASEFKRKPLGRAPYIK